MSDYETDNGEEYGKMIVGEKKEKSQGPSLVTIIFSWSLKDIFNRNLLKDKVKPIPKTFTSLEQYLGSYTYPLIEEARADLCSVLEGFSRAPFIEIKAIEKLMPERQLLYSMEVANRENLLGKEQYQPMDADLFVLSEMRPRHTSDLTRNERSYIIASVVKGGDEEVNSPNKFIIRTSKRLPVEKYNEQKRKRESLFAIYLLNMTTYNRIWKSLDLEMAQQRNTDIIHMILAYTCSAMGECHSTSSSLSVTPDDEIHGLDLNEFNLNDSQKNAVLDCLSVWQRQKNSLLDFHSIWQRQKAYVKLIWGPPGTGKTKTISTLLLALLMKKGKTLSCAPTNTAIVEVATRLLKLVSEACGNSCFLGDVILFGNKKRMNVDDNLSEIFLDDRVDRLLKCFMPLTGWRHCLMSMTDFLENALSQYGIYLEGLAEDDEERQTIMELTLKEFVNKRFLALARELKVCIRSFSADLPRTSTSEENFKKMNLLLELIKITGRLPSSEDITERVLEQLLKMTVKDDHNILSYSLAEIVHIKYETTPKNKFWRARKLCIQILKTLSRNLNLPNTSDRRSIEDFCLQGAILIFCTSSSSFRLHNIKMNQKLEILVVDEAAQLKECESLIPLQLSGIRHAIFIGDEHQLPALVKSQVSEKAAFGRSLFERLSSLGHEKHLLNVQYRMHPSISKFPNSNFYDKKISDGPNVMCDSYEQKYLAGSMYGAYSFMNIQAGKESRDSNGRSLKNMIEVAVIQQIIKNLFKDWYSWILEG